MCVLQLYYKVKTGLHHEQEVEPVERPITLSYHVHKAEPRCARPPFCVSRINSEPVFKDQFEHVLLGSCSNLHRKCAAEMQVLTRRYRFMLIVLVFCVFRYLDPPNKNKKEREKLAMASPIKALTKKQVDLSGYVSQPEKALASYCNRHSCRGISRSVVLPVDCECDSLV